ncbi:MAG TPA: hypothetical protein VK191_13015 [Symbiobacteriaceae bacterium]|nr:hypothetical protein [Symbiobacteriaceae bacterium]
MSLEEIREALRKLPPDQLRQLLAEFSEVPSASDREAREAVEEIIQQYKPALKRLADR